jgi:hypothetical protein
MAKLHVDLASPSSAAAGAASAAESVPSPSAPGASSPSSSSTSPDRLGPDPRTIFLPVQLHAIATTYIAKSNHFLQCDPVVVVAVDNRPSFKTTIRPNSVSCSWDLANPKDVAEVPGGLKLGKDVPTLRVPLSDLPTSKLQVHLEDYSARKNDDDMGGFSMSIDDIVTKSWKVESKKVSPIHDGVGTPAATPRGPPAGAAAVAAPSAPISTADGWYSVSIDNASLLDRQTGRHLGEISLKVRLQLEPYLRYLVASQTGLHLLYALVQQFLSSPSVHTPLRHILLHPSSLRELLSFVVKAASDKGSMEGERMRQALFPMMHKALDVFKPESTILDALFENDSDGWKRLFQLRKCIPLATISSTQGWNAYVGILDNYITFVERVGLHLEPLPPPPVKTVEELEAEAQAEAQAAKKAAIKLKKLKVQAKKEGVDPDDEEEFARYVEEQAAEKAEAAASSSSLGSKKKKRLLSGSSLPDPPVHLASKLDFGLNTLEVLHELFEVIRIRLSGFKKPTGVDLDWTNESKLADLVACCELWYKWQPLLFRYGSKSGLPPASAVSATPATPATPAETPATPSTPSSLLSSVALAAPAAPANGRMGVDEIRPFFLKEAGDANAVWLQKQLVSCVKKSKETLGENRELASKLQQHADYWIKLYPVQKETAKEKKASSNKKR